jgi:hypothetical protein
MKGDTIFQNVLPNSCPGLQAEKPFMYRVRLQQLCAGDQITILEGLTPAFMQGASCGLGEFHEIDETQAAALKDKSPRPN